MIVERFGRSKLRAFLGISSEADLLMQGSERASSVMLVWIAYGFWGASDEDRFTRLEIV